MNHVRAIYVKRKLDPFFWVLSMMRNFIWFVYRTFLGFQIFQQDGKTL